MTTKIFIFVIMFVRWFFMKIDTLKIIFSMKKVLWGCFCVCKNNTLKMIFFSMKKCYKGVFVFVCMLFMRIDIFKRLFLI